MGSAEAQLGGKRMLIATERLGFLLGICYRMVHCCTLWPSPVLENSLVHEQALLVNNSSGEILLMK